MDRDKRYPSLGTWTCLKTIGNGMHSKVKLARDSSTGEEVAIKIIKLSNTAIDFKRLKEEVEMMKKIDNPNVIKLKEFHEQLDYKKPNGKSVAVAAIVMELAKGGELYEYIKRTGRFTEEEARTFFHVLIETLQAFHAQGIVHRSIRSENLLFDADFNLKIADFGYSTSVISSQGYKNLTTIPLADSNLAPEVLLKQSYDGMTLDLFSASIVLFMMVSGLPPFGRAELKDPYYKLIFCGRYDNFWTVHERGKGTVTTPIFSESFKDFINAMFAPEPTQRLMLSEIKSHPWYTGKTEPIEQIKEKFVKRQMQVELELNNLKEEKAKEKKKIKERIDSQINLKTFTGIKVFRNSSQDLDIDSQLKAITDISLETPRLAYPFSDDICKPLSRLMTTEDPAILFKHLVYLSNTTFNKCEVSPTHYKILGRIFSDDGTCEIKITISVIDEDSNCVEFIKRRGSSTIFYRSLEEKLLPNLKKALSS